MTISQISIWIISLFTIGGILIRPFKIREAVWAVSGALLLLICGLIAPAEGVAGIAKGTDVYLFLIGMMLLAETAREEKLFDWLAAHATRISKGSPNRLFLLIYLVGTFVTVFLSNDATAVVLTPAVTAAVQAAKVRKPLPYLLICAFIANAASFVLPISNPANLVIYRSHLPSLLQWVPLYFLPSLAAITVTYLMLWLTQHKTLRQPIESNIHVPSLSGGGKTAIVGIGSTAIILLLISASGFQLGLPTAITGILTALVVLMKAKRSPLTIVKGVSWAMIPLVGGLFVIVEALNKTGVNHFLSAGLHHYAEQSVAQTAWISGAGIAFISNLVNNLPAGLIAGDAIQAAHVPGIVKSSVLIGVDLGPNLSVTGSLATILWLVALRREGLYVSAWTFLKLGAVIMTTALITALAVLWI